ncbi:ABC transporter substrate-binding protein [Cohnella herbarum]|uniref:Extracellular solute-binding protein n=1 Tax=Cohnella herbarum TaxID=2728023 RepID=A0A7Z2VNK1_9BACL|nr:extracellular solute-binding protein [Cohnella herbarum]QJD86204.1 extracellular solute-binding protein [Cohnella herbarum]
MNIAKRYLTLLVILAIAVLAGCGGAGNSDSSPSKGSEGSSKEKIKLTVTSSMTDEARMKLMDETIKVFNKKRPDVEIEFSPSPWSQYAQTLKLAFSSDSGQDVVYVDDNMQQMLQKNNYLMDITDAVNSKGWVDKQLPGAVDFNNLRTPGKYYSAGFIMAPVVVYYNKNIFTELGVTPPKTMDEFNGILEKAKAAGYVPMENGGLQNSPLLWSIFNMVFGKLPMDDIKKFYFQEGATPAFEQAFIDALKQANDWIQKGYFRKEDASLDGASNSVNYAAGKTAMVVSGDWDLGGYQATNVPTGIFAFPQIDSSLPQTIVNSVDGGWALNAKLSEEKKQAALDFIDVFMDPEVVKMWVEGGSTTTVKFDSSTASLSDMQKELNEAVKTTSMGFYLDNAVPGLLDVMIKQTQMMQFGQSSPEQVWNNINAEYQKLVKAANGQ